MVAVRILDEANLRNVVAGATFLGAGGGGSPLDGLKLVDKIFEVTNGIELVDPSEVPDNAYVGMIAGIGSPRVFKEKGFDVEAIYVYEELERLYSLVGAKLSYLMAGELGGFNTITPMYVAANRGLPIVDCDGNGRAVPELDVGLYPLYRIPAPPLVLADRNGNVMIGYPKDPLDTKMCESLARGFAVASDMSAAFGAWTVNGHTMKKSFVLNSARARERNGDISYSCSRS